MKTTLRQSIGLLISASVLNACGGTEGPIVNSSDPVDSSGSEIKLSSKQNGTTMIGAMTTMGLASDLQAFIGNGKTDPVEIPGIIYVGNSYGVDLLQFAGRSWNAGYNVWSAGSMMSASGPMTANVNGHTVAILSLRLDDKETTTALFNAMANQNEVNSPNGTARTSPHGRLSCEKLKKTGKISCTITGIISLGGAYWY